MIEHAADTFRGRLARVLAGRRITPWAESIGLTTGMVDRLNKGGIPRADVLQLVARVEGVNLHWLLTGTGRPYEISAFQDAGEALAYAGDLLADEAWTVILVQGPGRDATAVLTLPAAVDVGDREVRYTVVEVVAGPPGTAWSRILPGTPGRAWRLRVDDDTGRALRAGRLGPYQLVGEGQGGLLAAAEPVCLAQVAEAEPDYDADPIGAAYAAVAARDPGAARRRLLELLEETITRLGDGDRE